MDNIQNTRVSGVKSGNVNELDIRGYNEEARVRIDKL